jgi:hypothetical protein
VADGDNCGQMPYEHGRHPFEEDGMMKMCNGDSNQKPLRLDPDRD